MDADFSTQALQYQTTILRNTRLGQDASLLPWAANPEELKTTAVAQLHRIAGFTPDGGFSEHAGPAVPPSGAASPTTTSLSPTCNNER